MIKNGIGNENEEFDKTLDDYQKMQSFEKDGHSILFYSGTTKNNISIINRY